MRGVYDRGWFSEAPIKVQSGVIGAAAANNREQNTLEYIGNKDEQVVLFCLFIVIPVLVEDTKRWTEKILYINTVNGLICFN